MSSLLLRVNPFDFFVDGSGTALDAGYIYIGQPNKDPRSYPVDVYFDEALTIPAVQPLRTSNGYIVSSGTPSFLFVNGNYSVMVLDKNNQQVYYVADVLLIGNTAAISSTDLANSTDFNLGVSLVGGASRVVDSIASLRLMPKTKTPIAFVTSYYGDGKGGGGWYKLDSSDTTSTDNGGTIIVGADGGRWKLTQKDVLTIKQFGAKCDGTTDDSSVINAALASGAPVVDFLAAGCKINSSVTVPAGIEARNMNLTAGTAGINMVLVNNGCRVSGVLTGTGTKSIVERGIYPAVDGAADVDFSPSLTVQNMTFGVQAQPLTTTNYANTPKRWTGKIIAKNIVGTVGASEGYALLMSPAMECKLHLEAFTIQRHGVYLSAGATLNIIDANIDGIQNVACQFNTTGAQPATELNTVRVKVRNMTVPSGQSPNQVVGCYILGNSHRNKVELDIDGAGTAEAAVTFEGVAADLTQQPTGNRVSGRIKGQFLGGDVIKHLGDACNTTTDCTIDAYATFSVIAFRSNGVRSGANLPWSGPRAYGNTIKALGQSIIGIYDEVTDVVTHIGENDIRNNGTGNRVQIQANVKRTGFSRRVFFSGTTGSIAAGATGDQGFALPDPVSTTNRNASARVIGASGSLLANSPITAIFDGADTNITVRIFNGTGAAQSFNVTGMVEGD